MIRICAEITADCFAHLLLFESRPYGGHFGHEITKGIIISTLRFFAIPVVLPWEVNLPSLVTHLRPLGQKSNIFRHLSPSSVPYAFHSSTAWATGGQLGRWSGGRLARSLGHFQSNAHRGRKQSGPARRSTAFFRLEFLERTSRLFVLSASRRSIRSGGTI